MDIAILGAGNVGGTLGKRFVKAGHRVFWGVPDPSKPEYRKLARSQRGKASIGTVREAAASSHVIVVATPWSQTHDALQEAGDLTGKVLVDCTNSMNEDLQGLAVDCNTSNAEEIAKWVPAAKVCKSFNHTGANIMANPKMRGGLAVNFVCGNDEEAKRVGMKLAADIGFEPIDAGPLWVARILEGMALLWVNLAYKGHMGRNFAFAIRHAKPQRKSTRRAEHAVA